MSRSVAVEEREEAAKVVAVSAEMHAKAVGEKLNQKFRELVPEGQKIPNYVQVIMVAGLSLRPVLDELIAVDDADDEQVGGDAKLRELREKAVAALIQSLQQVRGSIEAGYSKSVARRLGFRGKMPRAPKRLIALATRLCERVVRVLAKETPIPGITIDAKVMVRRVREPLEQLVEASEALRVELRATQASKIEKARALERFDRHYQGVANLLTDLYNLVGEFELADQVRPTVRKYAAAEVEVEDEDDLEDEEEGEEDTETDPE